MTFNLMWSQKYEDKTRLMSQECMSTGKYFREKI